MGSGSAVQAAPAGQQTLLGNTKVLLLHQPRHLPDVAAGVLNLAPHQKLLPYLVASTAPRAIGYSLGFIGIDHHVTIEQPHVLRVARLRPGLLP
jgi:hypothetical protein